MSNTSCFVKEALYVELVPASVLVATVTLGRADVGDCTTTKVNATDVVT